MSRSEQTPFNPQPTKITQENNLLISLENNLPRDKREGIAWRKMPREEIISYLEIKAQELLKKGKKLTSKHLGKNKMSWFDRAVYKYYPGGLRSLKTKFDQSIKRHDYWNTDTVKDEVTKFVDVHKDINTKLLIDNKRGDLLKAIKNSYLGGLTQLRIDCEVIRSLPFKDNLTGWTTCHDLAKKIGLNKKTVKKYLQRFCVPSMQGIGGQAHRELTLYNESKALEVLEQIKKQSSSKIDSTEANEYMRKLLSE